MVSLILPFTSTLMVVRMGRNSSIAFFACALIRTLCKRDYELKDLSNMIRMTPGAPLKVTQGRAFCAICDEGKFFPTPTDSVILSKIDVDKLVSRLGRQFVKEEEATSVVKEFARFLVLKMRAHDYNGSLMSPSPFFDTI
jgi:hypothetical protein